MFSTQALVFKAYLRQNNGEIWAKTLSLLWNSLKETKFLAVSICIYHALVVSKSTCLAIQAWLIEIAFASV